MLNEKLRLYDLGAQKYLESTQNFIWVRPAAVAKLGSWGGGRGLLL